MDIFIPRGNWLARGMATLGISQPGLSDAAVKEHFQRGFESALKTHAPLYYKRGYAAAKNDRLTSDWKISGLSADGELRFTLRTIRNRSRDLRMNNGYMIGFIDAVGTNVIGENGMTLKVGSYDFEKQTDGSWKKVIDVPGNTRIEDGWWKWGHKKYASVNGRYSWIDLQTMCMETAATDGEAFFHKVRMPHGNPFGFALKPIEADYVDENYNIDLQNGRRVRMGIEIDADETPVAYHIFAAHPGDYMWTMVSSNLYRVRVPADEIIHYYIPSRFHQTRGVPWGHAAILNLNMIGAYEEAELVASRLAAQSGGTYKMKTGEEFETPKLDPEQEEELETFESGPGYRQVLPPGVEYEPDTPQHPVGNFGPFLKTMLRGACTAWRQGYNFVANDYEGFNYTSSRAEVFWERAKWRKIQRHNKDHFQDDVYAPWLDSSMLTGAVNLPYSKYEKFSDPEWRPRTWTWVEPLKDIQAAVIELDKGLTTRTRILAEKGEDFLEVMDEYKAELDEMQARGLDFSKGDVLPKVPVADDEPKGGIQPNANA